MSGLYFHRHVTLVALALALSGQVLAQEPVQIEQNWTGEERALFRSTSTGSQIMPHAWFKALERADSDALFLADGLERYGFLPLAGNPDRLPLGFTIDRDRLGVWTGLGCAACHTGEIRYGETTIRIDGAPAQADIQTFLVDIADALDATVANRRSAKFDRFARSALKNGGEVTDNTNIDRLFDQATAFARRWRARLISTNDGASWGHGRADAFARSVRELEIATASNAITVEPHNGAVSLPHLWGATAHSHGQWTASAPTDTLLGRLARNTGDMFAFFATAPLSPDRPDFPSSIRHFNLLRQERLLAKLWSPQWREDLLGPINWDAAEAGETLYQQHCISCHQLVPHGQQSEPVRTHAEPIATATGDGVGTDEARARIACELRVSSGSLEGYRGLAADKPLEQEIPATQLLDLVVDGLLLSPLTHGSTSPGNALFKESDWDGEPLTASLQRLDTRRAEDGPLFDNAGEVATRLVKEVSNARAESGDCGQDSPLMRYKARPLDGIWATAPYLHNGSIASLYELLLPAPERMKMFYVGSKDFDPVTVGFDPAAGDGRTLFDTTKPGNSNAGHDTYGNYGFSAADRRALVEYLKTL